MIPESLSEYFRQVEAGEEVANEPMVAFCNSHERVVLWGASFLGTAVGRGLRAAGVRVDGYWDLRSEEIGSVDGIRVTQPFTGETPGDRTLVIVCITNNVILGSLMEHAIAQGYPTAISGSLFYMAVVCGFSKSRGADVNQCKVNACCNAIYCRKLASILHDPVLRKAPPADDPLLVTNMLVIVNTRCNLSCKYCLQYLGSYPAEKRVNYPLEQICSSAERFFAAVDSVSSITIMGGETFLHPDITGIVAKMLSIENLGFMNIATNGTVRIRPEQMEGIQHERSVLCFSNYLDFVGPKQQEIWHENLELAKRLGIQYRVSLPMPQWAITSTLYPLGRTPEQLARLKEGCISPEGALQLRGNKLHPCDFANGVDSIVGDFPGDYVTLDDEAPVPVLRQRIRDFFNAPFYRACDYCRGTIGFTEGAGEQGHADFLTPPADGDLLGHIPH
jgi:hypothetical protein